MVKTDLTFTKQNGLYVATFDAIDCIVQVERSQAGTLCVLGSINDTMPKEVMYSTFDKNVMFRLKDIDGLKITITSTTEATGAYGV